MTLRQESFIASPELSSPELSPLLRPPNYPQETTEGCASIPLDEFFLSRGFGKAEAMK
jgi:hypothetical protein